MPKLPVTVCDDVISEKASCTADQVSLRAATARRLGECDQLGTASDSTSIVGVDSMSVDRVCPSRRLGAYCKLIPNPTFCHTRL